MKFENDEVEDELKADITKISLDYLEKVRLKEENEKRKKEEEEAKQQKEN